MSERQYDIIIAGGGMIGTSLALALAPSGLRIAVVEAVARKQAAQPSFDDRSTALSRSTQRMFEAMGLWPEIVAASTPIRSIHVSDKGRFGFSHIDAKEQGVEALGYVVINRVLGEVLQTALNRLENVDVLCPARIVDVDLETERATATVGLEQGGQDRLDCALLVAADGANSAVRSMMGITVQKTDYGQRAVIGNLLPEKPVNNVAYERFTPQGPLAILPLADERAGFVWTISESDAERVMSLDDAAFLEELQREFGYRLGAFSRVGKRASYPLRDVAAIVDCIVDARAQNDTADLGDATLLKRYADWRHADQKKLVRFTDGLVKLFGSERPPLPTLRDIGMLGFDLVPGVRTLFARHTMGLAGRLPRLSRGVPVK